jgi:ABC-type amino acid transport system permease subunit
MRNISPTLMNEMVTMVKESAIVGAVGIQDLMRRAQLVSMAKYDFFTPLVVAALIYYFLGLGMTWSYSWVTKKYFHKWKF